jgi:hypothetical protein
MRASRKVIFGLMPILIILIGAVAYEYGYLRIKSEIAVARDEEAVKMKTLRKYVSFIAKKAEFEAKLAALNETRKADDAKLIQGQTASVAAAALQTTVKSLMTSRGGTVSSERVEKPEDLGKFKVIGVSIDGLVPDMRALNDVLYAVETQTPYLVVGEIDARVKDLREPRELMTRLKVLGMTAVK